MAKNVYQQLSRSGARNQHAWLGSGLGPSLNLDYEHQVVVIRSGAQQAGTTNDTTNEAASAQDANSSGEAK